MSTYAERTDTLIDTLDDVAASIKQAQYELGGEREDAAEALGNIAQARKTLDEAERRAVSLLRSGGATWHDVGDALGTTRQAAHEKFSLDDV